MRYQLSDCELNVIRPMLPNKARGIPRVDDRRISTASFGSCDQVHHGVICPRASVPIPTCYNRFVRWRQAGVWDRIMDALAGAHDAAVQMIDTSVVRVHQHGSCIAGNREQLIGRSRGGLASKIHAVVDEASVLIRRRSAEITNLSHSARVS
jgi:transposase